MPESNCRKSHTIAMPIVDGFADYQYNEAGQRFILIS